MAGVCGAVVERGASSENEYQQGLDVVQWDRGAEGGAVGVRQVRVV